MMTEPTSRALWGRGAGCLSGVGNYLLGTWVQAVYAVSEPTSGVLLGRGADCLSSVGPYLPRTVWQWCKLFKWFFPNLPPGYCGTVLQAVLAVSEPTSRALWGRSASCLSVVGTYLPGTVGQVYWVFKWCLNLPPGHCVAGVQVV